ncbi:MAG: hypothetical protein JNM69_40475 [Archangium sp.]|nr:hypothetical protein [Archangium sp.]
MADQKTQAFHGEFFAKLAREELERGAVWMAEMAARLAQQVDAKNEEYAALLTVAMQARREATGE